MVEGFDSFLVTFQKVVGLILIKAGVYFFSFKLYKWFKTYWQYRSVPNYTPPKYINYNRENKEEEDENDWEDIIEESFIGDLQEQFEEDDINNRNTEGLEINEEFMKSIANATFNNDITAKLGQLLEMSRQKKKQVDILKTKALEQLAKSEGKDEKMANYKKFMDLEMVNTENNSKEKND